MVEDDVQFENVITTLEQTPTPAEARAQARAEARAETRAEIAQARAQAQEEAQRVRDEGHRIRDEAQRIREQVHRDVERQVRGELGVGRGPQHPGPGEVIVVPSGTPPPWVNEGFPPQIVDIMTMFVIGMVICIVGFPIARAFGRWIDRRGLPSPVSGELAAQMNRIEQAIDTMAVEVERISEAQRFQAKLLTERERAGA